jgi:voltage-gated potassium channel
MPEERLQRVIRAFEWPVALLALLVIPALVMEEHGSTPQVREAATLFNWIVWLAFCAEFGIRWAADRTLAFPRKAWVDLLLILISPPFGVPDAFQGVRSLRILRLLRLARAVGVAGISVRLARRHFARRKFHYVMLVTVVMVVLGAAGVYSVERGENKAIGTFGDALWWAVVTVTTVGYGDVSPVTAEGRLIAVVLMVTGIGVIGVFTATVATFLFEDQQQELTEISARLSAIERRLDKLLPPE